MKRWMAIFFLAGTAAAAASPLASPLVLPPAPSASVTQRIDEQLPLSLVFADDTGARIALAELFRHGPVLMMLGYYRCPNLCSTLMEEVLHSLAGVQLPPGAYRIVAVSIDPHETPEIAAQKRLAYMPMLGERAQDLALLTGSPDVIARLAQAAGFSYRHDARTDQYAHPAAFLIATPEGKISRYFMGVDFHPRDLRLALTEASGGRIGSASDRLALLCSHYDPATGRYSVAVMRIVRVVCIAVLALLLIWLWRRGRGAR